MRPHRLVLPFLAATALLADSRSQAQQPRQPEPRPPQGAQAMQVRVYDVSDIVGLRPDYPYRGAILPTTLGERPGAVVGGFGAGGLGGGMGMGGIGGGGFFQIGDPGVSDPGGMPGVPGVLLQFEAPQGQQVSDSGGMPGLAGSETGVEPAAPRITINHVIDAIQSTIDAEWEEIDGVGGVIARLGTLLIVRQTPSVHEQIQNLLTALGTAGAGSTAVTVEAQWLLLGSEELDRLVPRGEDGRRSARVDREALKEIAEKSSAYHGRITCFSDQTVHIISGSRRTVITGAVPTVGMGSSAYHPILAYPNAGVLLQVRPSLLPDRRSAILSVTSTVTGWEDAGSPVRIGATFLPGEKEGVPLAGGTAETSIDRVNMPTQHLETALRVPLGAPVLVGGMTVPQAGGVEKSAQLYLVVEVTTDQP